MSWAWQAAQEGLAAPASPAVILRQPVPQPAMLTGTERLRQRRSPVGIRTIRVARITPAGLMTLAARTILVGQADQVTRGVPVARITLVVQGTRGAVPAAQAIQAAAPVTLAEIRAVVPVTPAVIPVTPEVEVRNK